MLKYCLVVVALICSAALTVDAQGRKTVDVITFGSCLSQDEPQPVWDAIRSEIPDMFIFLGDNIYGDTRDMDVLRAKYNQLNTQPGYRALRQSTRILATWDDHDYGADDAGREYPMQRESKEIFLDFFDEPEDSLRRRRPGIYTSYMYGPKKNRVQVILLDLRTFRSPLFRKPERAENEGPYQPDYGSDNTLMGADQWEWLEKQLKKPARLRIIASSIQFAAEFHGWESWANMPRERVKMIKLIESTRANGVVFISGDMHYGELSVLNEAVPYPLYDFTSSGLNRSWTRNEENQHRISEQIPDHNYGVIRMDWKVNNPQVHFELKSEFGLTLYNHTVALDSLRTRK